MLYSTYTGSGWDSIEVSDKSLSKNQQGLLKRAVANTVSEYMMQRPYIVTDNDDNDRLVSEVERPYAASVYQVPDWENLATCKALAKRGYMTHINPEATYARPRFAVTAEGFAATDVDADIVEQAAFSYSALVMKQRRDRQQARQDVAEKWQVLAEAFVGIPSQRDDMDLSEYMLDSTKSGHSFSGTMVPVEALEALAERIVELQD